MSGQPPPIPPRKKKRKNRKSRKVVAYTPTKNGQLEKVVPVRVRYNPKTERTTIVGSGPYGLRRAGRGVSGRGPYFNPEYFERLGQEFFGDKGKIVGEGIGSILKAFGLGPYTVKRNSLLQPGKLIDMGTEVPRMANDGDGEICKLSRIEYLGDLLSGANTPTDFTLEQFIINPSNPVLFPWLSAVANNFEEYEFHGLIFWLKTMASDVSTALSLGTMFGATQYNVSDPIFNNKQQLLNYEYANSRKVSESLGLPIECESSKNVLNHLFVAPNNVIPDNEEPKFYNLGVLNLGSEGCPEAGTPIAEVWCSYDVWLFKPKLTEGGELEIGLLSGHWRSSGTITAAAPLFGFADQPDPHNNLPLTLTDTTIDFPETLSEGHYLLAYEVNGSTSTGGLIPFAITYTNCEGIQMWSDSSISSWYSPGPGEGASSRFIMLIAFALTGPAARITLGTGATLPPTLIRGDLVVTQINGLLT